MSIHRVAATLTTIILLTIGQIAGAAPPHRTFVDGEVIVKYRRADDVRQAGHYRAMWGITTARTFQATGVRRVKLPRTMTVAQAIALYRSDPAVEYAEPNYRYRLQSLPDDAYLSQQWALRNIGQTVNGTAGTTDADIDAERAWDFETGDPDIVVAVVDSGVDTAHPDIAANLWTNTGEIPANGLDDDHNGYVDDVHGWDFAAGNNDPTDSDGHGTHVAGIISAVGDNGFGVSGVNWQVSIMPLRFITAANYGTTSDAIDAIEYAAANGADVINLSWGGSNYSQALKDAIDAADALVVCAAGNEGVDLDATPFYPASYDSANILSVAATDSDDHPAWFTNYSDSLADVAAPGTSILSTVPDRRTLLADDFSDLSNWLDDGEGNWGIQIVSGNPALSESPGGNYGGTLDTWIRLAPLNLTGRQGTRLDFWIVGTTASTGDYLVLEASTNGSTWAAQQIGLDDGAVGSISGTIATWQLAIVDLKAYDGHGSVYLRFRFVSNAAGTADGYRIDNLALTSAGSAHGNDDFAFYSGTSMSAAYAAGAAALVMGGRPSLLPTEVRLAMEATVDEKAPLAGIVATAGRINAYAALMSVAVVNLNARSASARQIDLDWIASEPVTSGFEIQRRPARGADYTTIAIVGADDAAYVDTGLDEGTTYVYRVLTLSGGERTGYSNETSATTAATVSVSGSSGGGGGGGGCFIRTAGKSSMAYKRALKWGSLLPVFLLALMSAAGRMAAVRRTGG